jgi:hypothetical protein
MRNPFRLIKEHLEFIRFWKQHEEEMREMQKRFAMILASY